jgi:tripartite-type tricarboxylate transporter receptor subunit TctC
VTGAESVARAGPDGYTLLMATVSTHAASPAMSQTMPYDPVKDFQPITNVMSVPSAWCIRTCPLAQ